MLMWWSANEDSKQTCKNINRMSGGDLSCIWRSGSRSIAFFLPVLICNYRVKGATHHAFRAARVLT